ncbi:putative peptidase family-domain-containing protein [Xylariaceae sp. FL0804]|nr:putative peptidase family-domain-containing protein [Xylariaceae sp. FL0804]
MPPSLFNFKELRRRSRASFRTERSTDTSSNDDQNATPTTGSITPPSIAAQSDPALHLQTKGTPPPMPTRPPLQSLTNTSTNRYSVSGMAGLGSPSLNGKSTLPPSKYAPRINNISDNSWVYQKVLLVTGLVGGGDSSLDGTLSVTRLDDVFPTTQWPVCNSRFKAMVYLVPGPNKLRFEFSSPKLANCGSTNPIHASYLLVHMVPTMNNPPLQLAILQGSDSPGTFDAVPGRAEKEGNGIETAIRKYRMAAYLWQAFTAEQMNRNKLGRRVFRFEEEWTTGTCNYRDREMGTMRSEARVHVIRTDKTMAELRDLQRAQQNKDATKKGDLFGIAADAVKAHFKPLPGQKQYVSVLLLDAHWDTAAKTVTAHAALGGNAGDLQLAIFGSHCMQSYPTSFEEIVPAFTDCTPTDTSVVANDCNEAGSSWEAANIGIGAHLHEVGHLFGCPHQESGIMLRDYVRLNRSFISREAHCTRTQSQGGPVTENDECAWHRLDCLRFRSHPCFRLPLDPTNADESVHAWPVENDAVMLTASSGISFVEIKADGQEPCRAWIEYPIDSNMTTAHRQIHLTEQQLRDKLPEDKRRCKVVSISVKSHAGGNLDIADFHKLCTKSSLKMSFGKSAFRSQRLGNSQMEGSAPHEFIFTSSVRKDRVLSRVVFYHGSAIDGLEFIYDDDSSQLFGKKGGKQGGDSFELDVRRSENITGFFVRSGAWIDAIQVWTSLGRKSPLYGNVHGGSPHSLLPPPGFRVCGVSGSCGAWVDGFSLIIARSHNKQKDALVAPGGHFSLFKAMHMADYITEMNGFCGIMSIFSSLRYCLGDPADKTNLYLALAFLPFGLFFDFMDGRVARWRKKSSMMGQELDSLADLISFGLAPACVAFSLGLRTTVDQVALCVFVLCGLTRLARFNVTAADLPHDASGKAAYFEGTPIPTTLGLDALMAYWVAQGWTLDRVPGGVWLAGTPLALHPVAALFLVHGCLMCSKSLHVPKP